MGERTGPLDHILCNEDYARLVRTRKTLMWSMTSGVLAIYAAFMAVVAFSPSWLAQRIYGASSLTVGIPSATLVILLSWFLTGWYVRIANSSLDTLSARIVKESAA
ncbi:hypothetical protein BZM26_24390 [Paraburkholderia strydomiana]|nr:hypothetical protein BZM26_24390 [Paraburkholderia strydomiana]